MKRLHDLTSPLAVPDACYNRVFDQDGDGAKIFEELAILFAGNPSFVPGEPDATAFNEGARMVVLYIQRRIDRTQTREG
ncbi:MAG TPA: hypothetical protein VI298_08655 [Geobacteraceae bacterium]